MSQFVNLGLTCNGDPSCAFTRTVAAVPEAQTWVMLVAGLGLASLADVMVVRPLFL